jgi:predicted MFS family arabinose efflux permease
MLTGRFGSALALPGVMRFFVPAAIARWGVAMSGLAVFWAVQGATGSLARAGTAVGVFSVTDALIGPQIAGLVDRFGQRRVMPFSVIMFFGAGAALSVASSGWAMISLAAVMGGTVPPVGALSAARWHLVTEATGLLPTALSLEGAVNELTFLTGPVLVTLLVSAVAPAAALVLVLGLVGLGIAGLLTAAGTEPVPAVPARGRRFLGLRFLGLFAVNLSMGFFFGGIGVAVAAFAIAHGVTALTGTIAATGGIVSLVIGLIYGSMSDGRPERSIFGAGLVIAVGCAVLAASPNVPAVFLGYAVVGGCVSLVLVPSAVLLSQAVAPGSLTQAMTWINSASAVGTAISAPLVGLAVENGTWRSGFLVLAGLAAFVPATVLACPRPDEERGQALV